MLFGGDTFHERQKFWGEVQTRGAGVEKQLIK